MTAPQLVSELLTLREASQRFGIDYRQVYVWAAEGLLHPVKPTGRTLYPEWELRALVADDRPTPRYRSRFEREAEAA